MLYGLLWARPFSRCDLADSVVFSSPCVLYSFPPDNNVRFPFSDKTSECLEFTTQTTRWDSPRTNHVLKKISKSKLKQWHFIEITQLRRQDKMLAVSVSATHRYIHMYVSLHMWCLDNCTKHVISSSHYIFITWLYFGWSWKRQGCQTNDQCLSSIFEHKPLDISDQEPQ